MEKEDRRLAAIMFTDMVGYSAAVQKNEKLALELLDEHRKILRSIFLEFGGNEVETAGDSFFLEFVNTLDAAKCAIEIQKTMFERNKKEIDERKIFLRIGLHVGDVVHLGRHVHGDGVNLAARLEPLASPGCICISEDAARQIQNKIEHPLLKVGKKKLKNIQLPIDVYKIVLPWELEMKKISAEKGFTFSNRRLFTILLIIIPLVITGYFIFQKSPDSLTIGSKNRIAVLPFANISMGNEDDYFAEGITEEII
ncbi:MAG TPA: adenylate/guanylate cyclase domain-containing protein, partial [Ignavibacteriaceae bacterium]|nr:adenylate/guanylate cyclase domain-containing protein [Ignavibacteriaceae bacterium]